MFHFIVNLGHAESIMQWVELKVNEPESCFPQSLELYHSLSWVFANIPDLGQLKQKNTNKKTIQKKKQPKKRKKDSHNLILAIRLLKMNLTFDQGSFYNV